MDGKAVAMSLELDTPSSLSYDKLEKFADKMRIERNTFLVNNEILKDDIKKLELKVEELETELYFCRRNNRIEDEVQKG